MNHPLLGSDERGVVSMLAVLLVSILLSIITLSIIRQTVDEQRLATDLSLSTKAFYAAEAGVEDSLYQLAAQGNLPADNDCSGDTTFIEASVSAYTCRLVESGSSTFEGQVPPADVFQLSLANASNLFNRLKLNWFRRNVDDPVGLGAVNYYGNNPSNKPANALPLMRVELIRYSRNGTFNRDNIEQAVMFLRPVNSSGTATINPPPFSHHASGGTVTNVNCPNATAAGDYMCGVTLSGLDSTAFNYILRLSAVYNNSFVSFNLETQNASGVPVANNLQTIVDVTARANDIYRRVRYRLPNQAVGITPQFAFLSDGLICKDPQVDGTTGVVTIGGSDACSLTTQ